MKEFWVKVWATIYDRVFVHWQTTVGGVLTVVLAWLYFDGVISADLVGIIIAIAGMFGIIIKNPKAKDGTNGQV